MYSVATFGTASAAQLEIDMGSHQYRYSWLEADLALRYPRFPDLLLLLCYGLACTVGIRVTENGLLVLIAEDVSSMGSRDGGKW